MIPCNLKVVEQWGWVHNSIVPRQDEDEDWLRYGHSLAGTSYLNMSFTTLQRQYKVAISSPMSGGATLQGTLGLINFRRYEGHYTMVNWIP